MQNMKLNGTWFFPNDSETRSNGHLQFDQQTGVSLEIFEDKFVEKYWDNNELNTPEVTGLEILNRFRDFDLILGYLENGNKVTLYNCKLMSQNQGIEFKSFRITAEAIILGDHFNSIDDLVFDSLSLNYEHLEDLFSDYGLLPSIEDGFYVWKYRLQPDAVVTLEHLELKFKLGFSEISTRLKTHIDKVARVNVHSSQKCDLETFLNKQLNVLESFLRFILDRKTYPIEVLAYREGLSTVTLLYAIDSTESSPYLEYLKPLFTINLSEEGNEFEASVVKWWEKFEKLEPVCDLYLLATQETKKLQTTFLLLVQALETYHRKFHHGTYMEKNNYKSVRKILADAIPAELVDDHKKSLKSKIDFGNEYSLKTRIKFIKKEIINDFDNEISNRLMDDDFPLPTRHQTKVRTKALWNRVIES